MNGPPRPPGKSAFPREHMSAAPGMSMREWYAGMALQGLLAANPATEPSDPIRHAARAAFALADAMIAEAMKGPS